jgi:hypothetical protein
MPEGLDPILQKMLADRKAKIAKVKTDQNLQ